MAKKSAFFSLAALAVFALACEKASVGGGAITLRYLANPDVGGSARAIIKKFEEENPGIRVEMVEGPSSSDTRADMYATSFMGKEDTYDLVYMDLAWLAKFAAQGWLRPLDEYFTPRQQAEFLPGDIEGSRFQGKIYRVPVQSDGGVLYYRKDLLAAQGIKPPRTWEEMVAISKRLQAPPNLWGFVFQGKQYEGLVCAYLELLWGNGGDLLDGAGQVRVDAPEAVEALQWLVDAIRKDKISPESVLTYQEEEARHAFQEGHAVFMRNWPYAWNLMQDAQSPVKGKFGMIPMVHGKGRASAATLGGWGFGVSAFSKNPEAAWKLAEFFSRPESEKIAFFKGGILPTRKAVFQDPEVLKASPQLGDIYRVLVHARPRPMRPDYARISDAMQLHLSSALSGQETPRAALSAAAQEIRAVIGR